MTLEMSLECFPFLLIIFEMFLHLDYNPPVANSTDWIWSWKANTCLYTGSDCWRCRSEQKLSNEVDGIMQSLDIGLCHGREIRRATKNCCIKGFTFPGAHGLHYPEREEVWNNRDRDSTYTAKQHRCASGTTLYLSLSEPASCTQTNFSGETWIWLPPIIQSDSAWDTKLSKSRCAKLVASKPRLKAANGCQRLMHLWQN